MGGKKLPVIKVISFLARDETMMKAILAALALVAASRAFQAIVPISSRSTSSSCSPLSGFLDGKGKAISVREDEDKKMWFEQPKKKQVVAAPVKGKSVPVKAGAKKAPAKPDPKKKKLEVAAGFNGFKFPWDK